MSINVFIIIQTILGIVSLVIIVISETETINVRTYNKLWWLKKKKLYKIDDILRMNFYLWHLEVLLIILILERKKFSLNKCSSSPTSTQR